MKKLIVFLLVLALVTFVGCDRKKSSNKDKAETDSGSILNFASDSAFNSDAEFESGIDSNNKTEEQLSDGSGIKKTDKNTASSEKKPSGNSSVVNGNSGSVSDKNSSHNTGTAISGGSSGSSAGQNDDEKVVEFPIIFEDSSSSSKPQTGTESKNDASKEESSVTSSSGTDSSQTSSLVGDFSFGEWDEN